MHNSQGGRPRPASGGRLLGLCAKEQRVGPIEQAGLRGRRVFAPRQRNRHTLGRLGLRRQDKKGTPFVDTHAIRRRSSTVSTPVLG